MEARNKSVQSWFSLIRDGLLTLPRFQRHEAWKPNQIEGVLENMLREPSLPIGALLILEVRGDELFVSRPISSAPPTENSTPKYNLLDGQQRITAIWRSLNDTYKDSITPSTTTSTVFFSLEDLDKPTVKVIKRTINKKTGTKLPAWVDDPAKCYQEKQFVPAKTLLPGTEGEKFMEEWIDDAAQGSSEIKLKLTKIILSLRARIANFQIPFLSLPADVGRDTALDIFVKMNTSSTPLKDFDIVVAQVEGATEGSLHDMIEDLNERVPDAKEFGTVEDIALSVGALLNDKPPLKKTYLDKTFGDKLEKVWDKVVTGIDRGTKFLRDEKIFNEKLLPTEGIIYLVSALWAELPEDGTDREGVARKLIRKAVWRASFTDRYLKTSTTTAFADYKSLRNLLRNLTPHENPLLFDDKLYPLPDIDELVRGGWPKRRERLGRAILLLSLQDGGRDFASDENAHYNNIQKREYHHIFPRTLVEKDFPDEVNSALNCALISWKTNRKISAKTPAEYIEERAKSAEISMDDVKKRLASHLIPFEELMAGDFEKFLDARAAIIHERMTKLANGID